MSEDRERQAQGLVGLVRARARMGWWCVLAACTTRALCVATQLSCMWCMAGGWSFSAGRACAQGPQPCCAIPSVTAARAHNVESRVSWANSFGMEPARRLLSMYLIGARAACGGRSGSVWVPERVREGRSGGAGGTCDARLLWPSQGGKFCQLSELARDGASESRAVRAEVPVGIGGEEQI